ncbi:MAG: SDR family oxidoreductase [Muribaculaceae bacterium]|nr:SDR family oxidoreductase [Muribaculaceae bacterium]
MKILLTGASGLLGRYLLPMLRADSDVKTLQRRGADFCCDLAEDVPQLGGERFDMVIHAAGSFDESEAFRVNYDGTAHLLEALEAHHPRQIIFLSSWEVYSPDAGENVEETHQTWASSKVGQSKARAEQLLAGWCAERNVTLTILRPARMMGKGVKGEMRTLFNDVATGRYIHVRGNDARLSLVCALDVAKAIKNLGFIGGIYNVADDAPSRWIDLAEAMSANCGAMKRQTFLPEKWADAAWRFTPWLPAVKASLSPDVRARRSKSLTLSSGALKEVLPQWMAFPTVDVVSRTDKDYPYED